MHPHSPSYILFPCSKKGTQIFLSKLQGKISLIFILGLVSPNIHISVFWCLVVLLVTGRSAFLVLSQRRPCFTFGSNRITLVSCSSTGHSISTSFTSIVILYGTFVITRKCIGDWVVADVGLFPRAYGISFNWGWHSDNRSAQGLVFWQCCTWKLSWLWWFW